MYNVLLTGFEPYWTYFENSSWVVAQEVAKCQLAGISLCTEQMPVSFARVKEAVGAAIQKHSPDLIIMLGQSGGSDRIKLERVAINLMDSKLPDNDGYIPNEAEIHKDGIPALFTNTEIKSLKDSVEAKGVRVKISNSCGLYVCNCLYYEVLSICRSMPSTKALFIHLPYYEGQSCAKPAKFTMPLHEMVRAVVTIIEKNSGKHQEV